MKQEGAGHAHSWEECSSRGYAKALPIICTFKVQRKQLLWLEVVSLGGDRGAGERGRDRGAGERGRPSRTMKGPHRLCKGLWIFAPRNALETSKEFQQGNDKPGQGFQGPQITWLILKTSRWFSKLKVGPRVVINNPYYSVGIF